MALSIERNTKAPSAEPPCAVSLSLRTPVDVPVAEYYSHFLELTEKLLDNHMDITVYEDAVREMFNVNAFKVFTLDKLILVTVRQVCECTSVKQLNAAQMQTLIADPQSQSLIGAYHNFLKFGNVSSYKAHAFTAIEGNAYKIEQKVSLRQSQMRA